MLISILLIITAIVLVIVVVLAIRLIDEIRSQQIGTVTDEQLTEAERLLIANLVINGISSIIIVFVVVSGFHSTKSSRDNQNITYINQRLYYKKSTVRFFIFLVAAATIISGFLSFEAKQQVNNSKLSTSKKKTICRHFDSITGLSWGVAIKATITLIFTFVGPKEEDLKQQLKLEEDTLKPKYQTVGQIDPYYNCTTGEVKWIMRENIPGYTIYNRSYLDPDLPIEVRPITS